MARALMRHALGSEHQEVWETLRFYETGARPEISSARKDIEFSLSHSRQLLCMAIGGSPVGIDCEWRGRKFRPELNEYLNSADDRAVLARLGQLAEDEHPVFSWCLREAWYKASAQHQKTAAAAIPLRRILDSGWQFQIFRISNHFGVIAAQQKFKVEALYCSPFRYELSLNTLEHDRIDHDKIVEATRP
ncbi:4'-phosphopantetheinyl transferase family protein [Marinobacterium lutimaris]|nr:hypothetical protein [Marinobacterium lutimaris]